MFLLDTKEHFMLIAVQIYSTLYVLRLKRNALRVYCTSVRVLIEYAEKILARNYVGFDGFVFKAFLFCNLDLDTSAPLNILGIVPVFIDLCRHPMYRCFSFEVLLK